MLFFIEDELTAHLVGSCHLHTGIFDFNMRPGVSAWPRPDCTIQPQSKCPNGTNPGRTHRFYTGPAVLPFGFGLSYTKFTYTLVNAPAIVDLTPVRQTVLSAASRSFAPFKALRERAGPVYIVNVTNTGAWDADDVVLGMLLPPGAGKGGVPLQTLFGFERVHVKSGAVWMPFC
jgi:hypothetical protein